MKKAFFATSCAVTLSFACLNVQANLLNGSTLSIGTGSYFDMLGQIPITGIDGVILGSNQPYDFSFTAARIDQFTFLGAQGMHYTTSPTNVLTSSGNMATVDFSGWSWAFNDAAVSFNLGSGSWGSNPNGIAEITCGIDCGNGDTYTLIYTATVPANEPAGYAGFTYKLNLTGTVAAVPIPAAAWLFCSGLLGLIGMARRKVT